MPISSATTAPRDTFESAGYACTGEQAHDSNTIPGSWSNPCRVVDVGLSSPLQPGLHANTPLPKPKLEAKPSAALAKPLRSGASSTLTSEQYDQKYGLGPLAQSLPANTKITDNGPTLLENAQTVLNGLSVAATGYLVAVGAPTVALASLPSLQEWLATGPLLHKALSATWPWLERQAASLPLSGATVAKVAHNTKVAATTIFADGAVDFGIKLDHALDKIESIRDEPGELSNMVCGINQSLPIKIGGFNFNGVFVSAFASNTSTFEGTRDAHDDVIRNDNLWVAIGVRPKKDNVFCGVINGLEAMKTGNYFRAMVSTSWFAPHGTAVALTIDANPFSEHFGEHVEMVDSYMVNSDPPKKPGNFFFQFGHYEKLNSDHRKPLVEAITSATQQVANASMTLPGALRPEPATPTAVLPAPEPTRAMDKANLKSAAAFTAAAAKQTYTVQRGDTLWGISKSLLGAGHHYPQLVSANAGQLKNANKIFPGQVLNVPR